MLYKYLKAHSAQINERNDCTVIALCVVAKMPYAKAHAHLASHGRKARHGCHIHQWMAAYEAAGVELHEIALEAATMRSAEAELRAKYAGRKVLLRVRGHVSAWDGAKIQDWAEGRLHRIEKAFLINQAE